MGGNLGWACISNSLKHQDNSLKLHKIADPDSPWANIAGLFLIRFGSQ